MNAMDTTIESSETLPNEAPTLASSAMLVEVNISNWTGLLILEVLRCR